MSVLTFLETNLSRVTNRKHYIPEVDGLRFIAIFPVVMLHLSSWFQKSTTHEFVVDPLNDWLGFLVNKGAFGVQVFFMLSGFILGLPFARQRMLGGRKVSLSLFYKRRLLRLEPPFIIVMVGAFFAQVLFLGENASELLDHLWASLAYVHTWIYGEWSKLNPVTWSLEVEVIFYILAPFLAALFFWKGNALFRRAVLLAALLGVTFISILFAPEIKSMHWEKTIFFELQYFLAGFFVADVFVHDTTDFFKKKSYLWDLVFIGCMVGIHAEASYRQVYHYAFPLYTILIFFAGFKGKLLNVLMRKKLITIIGGMCYTIYLIHYPLFAFFSKFTGHIHVSDHYSLNLIVVALVTLPILFVLSGLFFMLVERPCMKSDWPQQLGAFIKYRILRIQKS